MCLGFFYFTSTGLALANIPSSFHEQKVVQNKKENKEPLLIKTIIFDLFALTYVLQKKRRKRNILFLSPACLVKACLLQSTDLD
uniref:Putative secreted peptide n=1 Tax=Anopheles braziliensis TaxID=58242 RepID=A0A2M3ZWL7_9DIPT